MLAKLSLNRTRAYDDQRIIKVSVRFDKKVKPFVISQDPNEQEETIAQPLPPSRSEGIVWCGVCGRVESDRNDARFFTKPRQNITRFQDVLRRCNDGSTSPRKRFISGR